MNGLSSALLAMGLQVQDPQDTIWVPMEVTQSRQTPPEESILERVELRPGIPTNWDPFASQGQPREGFIVTDESGWTQRLVLDGRQGPAVERILIDPGLFLAGELPIYLAHKADSLALVAGERVFRIGDAPQGTGHSCSLEVVSSGDRWVARVVSGQSQVRRTVVDTGQVTDGTCTVHLSSSGRWGVLWRPDRRKLNRWGEARPGAVGQEVGTEVAIPPGESLVPTSVSFSPSGELAFLTRTKDGNVRLYLEGRVAVTSSAGGWWPRQSIGLVREKRAWGDDSALYSNADLDSWPLGSIPQLHPDISWIPVASSQRSVVPAALLLRDGATSSSVLAERSEWTFDSGIVQEILALDPGLGPIVVRERSRSEVYVSLGDLKGPLVSRVIDSDIVDGVLHYAATKDSAGESVWGAYRGFEAQPTWTSKALLERLARVGRDTSVPGRGPASVSHIGLTGGGLALVHCADYLIAAPLHSSSVSEVTVLGPADTSAVVLGHQGSGLEQIVWTSGRGGDVYVGSQFLCSVGGSPRAELLAPDRIELSGSDRRVTLVRRKLDELPAVTSSKSTVEPLDARAARVRLSTSDGTTLHGALDGASLQLALATRDPRSGTRSAPQIVGTAPLSPRALDILRKHSDLLQKNSDGKLLPGGLKGRGDGWERWPLSVSIQLEESKFLLHIAGLSWEPRPGSAPTSMILEAELPLSLRSGPFAGVGHESKPEAGRVWLQNDGLQVIHQSWAGTFLVTAPWSSIEWTAVDGGSPDTPTRSRIPAGKLDRRR